MNRISRSLMSPLSDALHWWLGNGGRQIPQVINVKLLCKWRISLQMNLSFHSTVSLVAFTTCHKSFSSHSRRYRQTENVEANYLFSDIFKVIYFFWWSMPHDFFGKKNVSNRAGYACCIRMKLWITLSQKFERQIFSYGVKLQSTFPNVRVEDWTRNGK